MQSHILLLKGLWMKRFLLLLSIFASLLPAQTTSGSITGTVTDSTGAAIAGAKIVARMLERALRTTR